MSAAKQRGRMRKLECEQCGCILYGSGSAIRDAGLPTCRCGGEFTIPNLRDLIVIDPEAFERTVDALTVKARNAVMRDLGYTMEIQRKAPPRITRQPQCRHANCSKFRAYGKQYCHLHEELEAMPF